MICIKPSMKKLKMPFINFLFIPSQANSIYFSNRPGSKAASSLLDGAAETQRFQGSR